MHFREAAKNLQFPVDLTHGNGFGLGFYRTILGSLALQTGTTAHFQSIEGFPTVSLSDLTKAVAAVVPNMQTVTQDHPQIRKSYTNSGSYAYELSDNEFGDSFRVWDTGYINFDFYQDESVKILVGCLDELLLQKIIGTLEPLLAGDCGEAKITVISNSGHGPMLRTVGEGGTPLIRENYSPEALEVFDHIVQDIAHPHPCGRLSVFTGPPGTGKTYFLEGIIAAQKGCRYVVLPPEVIRNVAAPDLLRVLLPDDDEGPGRSRNGSQKDPKKIPTVLLIEDADEVLTNRQLDNLPAISAILNLTDGILGRALDIRILATSNIKIKDVDKALIRSGRRCRLHDFQSLTPQQAQVVYNREIAKFSKSPTRTFDFNTTLADVYRTVKEDA